MKDTYLKAIGKKLTEIGELIAAVQEQSENMARVDEGRRSKPMNEATRNEMIMLDGRKSEVEQLISELRRQRDYYRDDCSGLETERDQWRQRALDAERKAREGK